MIRYIVSIWSNVVLNTEYIYSYHKSKRWKTPCWKLLYLLIKLAKNGKPNIRAEKLFTLTVYWPNHWRGRKDALSSDKTTVHLKEAMLQILTCTERDQVRVTGSNPSLSQNQVPTPQPSLSQQYIPYHHLNLISFALRNSAPNTKLRLLEPQAYLMLTRWVPLANRSSTKFLRTPSHRSSPLHYCGASPRGIHSTELWSR